ncbi:MAG: hypothetical protein KC912_26060 [Proteobacteria bacterium]|nr:hypothetical protein [Pseudomonadota bacterium]
MWLIALVACFDPAARPYEDYGEDLRDVTDTASAFTACSEPVGQGRNVLFGNESEGPVELWYVLPSCDAEHRADIDAGDRAETSASEGDVFRFRLPGEAFTQEVVVDGVALYYGFEP